MNKYIDIKPNFDRNRLEIDFYGNRFIYCFDKVAWYDYNFNKLDKLPLLVVNAIESILEKTYRFKEQNNRFIWYLANVYKMWCCRDHKMKLVALVFWTCRYNNSNELFRVNDLFEYFKHNSSQEIEKFYQYCYTHNCGYEKYINYKQSDYNNIINDFGHYGLRELYKMIGQEKTYKFIDFVEHYFYKENRESVYRVCDKLYAFFKGLL